MVTTNDPDHPTEALSCEGQVLEPLKMIPKYANFGQISAEVPRHEKKISLTRGDGGPLSLELDPIRTPGVEANLKEIEAGERYELLVALTGPFEAERIRATLQLETGVPESPRVTIPVYATLADSRALRRNSKSSSPWAKGAQSASP